MEDITKRGREWDDKHCDEFAAFDASREPKEFLPQYTAKLAMAISIQTHE